MSREYFRPGVLPPAPRRLDGRSTALLAAPPGTAQLALSQGQPLAVLHRHEPRAASLTLLHPRPLHEIRPLEILAAHPYL